MEDSLRDFLSAVPDWEDQTKDFPKIPEGTYQAQLVEAELCQSKKGNWQVKRQHLILSGEQKSQVLFDYMQLETPRGLSFLGAWIRKMGYEVPTNPLDLEDVIIAINDQNATVQLQVVHSDDFVNGRVLELLEAEISA